MSNSIVGDIIMFVIVYSGVGCMLSLLYVKAVGVVLSSDMGVIHKDPYMEASPSKAAKWYSSLFAYEIFTLGGSLLIMYGLHNAGVL